MTAAGARDACSNDVVLWPDGTWCYREELSEFTHMSDDYEIISYYTDRWHDEFHHDIDQSHRKNGLLAFALDGSRRPLQVLESAAGFYLGTLTDDGCPNTRESDKYWPTREEAAVALTSGQWPQKLQP